MEEREEKFVSIRRTGEMFVMGVFRSLGYKLGMVGDLESQGVVYLKRGVSACRFCHILVGKLFEGISRGPRET